MAIRKIDYRREEWIKNSITRANGTRNENIHIRSSRKMGILLLVGTLAGICLTGCQETPKEDVIVQKNELEERVTAAAQLSEEQQSMTLRNRIGAPETITFELTNPDNDSKYIAEEAKVWVPETSQAGTASLKRCDYTDEDTTVWTKVFFGEGEVWKREDYVMVKADYLEAIQWFTEELSNFQADYAKGVNVCNMTPEDAQNYVTYLQQEIDTQTQLMEQAPETAPEPKKEPVEYHLKSISQEEKGSYQMFDICGTLSDGSMGTLVIQNTEYGTYGSFLDNSTEEISPYPDKNWEEGSDAVVNCRYSLEESIGQVMEVANQLQPGNQLKVASVYPFYDANLELVSEDDTSASQEQTPKEYLGYAITLTRSVGDMTENDSNFSGEYWDQEEADYIPFGYERIQAYVSDKGVFQFSWMNRMTEGEVLQENVELLSFERVLDIIKKHLPMFTMGCCGENGVIHNIKEIRLGLMSVRKPNDNESFTLIPVWDVYAVMETQDAVWEEYMEDCLTVNGLDGSVIDRDRRY